MQDLYSEYEVHLIPPSEQKQHIASMKCWCNPKKDPDEPTVIIHNRSKLEPARYRIGKGH